MFNLTIPYYNANAGCHGVPFQSPREICITREDTKKIKGKSITGHGVPFQSRETHRYSPGREDTSQINGGKSKLAEFYLIQAHVNTILKHISGNRTYKHEKSNEQKGTFYIINL